MYRMSLSCVLLAGAAFALIATDAMAATAQEQRQQKQAEIPRCPRPLALRRRQARTAVDQ